MRIIKLISAITFIFCFALLLSSNSIGKVSDKTKSDDTTANASCKDTFFCTGDSMVCTVILYSKQDFRIMVCGDQGYSSVNFKISEPNRETLQKVNKINESEEIIYKLDEYGEPVLGSDDKPVVLSKDVLRDTIWDKSVLLHETILFEGTSNGKNFFDIPKNEKTRRINIIVYTTGAKSTSPSCVSIMVGRRYNKPFQISAQ